MKQIFFLIIILVTLTLFGEDKDPQEPAVDQKEKETSELPENQKKDSAQLSEQSPGAGVLDPIIITATRMKTSQFDTPASVSVATEKDIITPDAKTPLAAFDDVSGFKRDQRQENFAFSGIEVRGLTSNATSGGNVLMLLDGIPQHRLSFGGPYLGTMPLEPVVRMELVKGAVSSLYGKNALSGAIQLFTDPGTEQFFFRAKTDYELITNSLRSSLKTTGPLWGTNTFSLTGVVNDSQGWVENSEAVQGNIYGHFTLNLTAKDTLTILAGFFGDKENNVSPVWTTADGNILSTNPLDPSKKWFDRSSNFSIPDQNTLRLYEYRAAALYDHSFTPDFALNMKAAYWHGDTLWQNGRIGNPSSDSSIAVRGADNRQFLEDTVFTEAQLDYHYSVKDILNGGVNVGASFEYLWYKMTQTNITTAELYEKNKDQKNPYKDGIPIDLDNPVNAPAQDWVYGPESRRDTWEYDASAFLQTQNTFIKSIHMFAGLRFDWYSNTQAVPVTSEQATLSDYALSPSVGLSYSILSFLDNPNYLLDIYGNWGMGFSPVFRAVNNTEIAKVGPERSMSGEVGLKARLFKKVFEMSLAFYQQDRTDIVGDVLDPATNKYYKANQGNWRIRGVEVDIRSEPCKYITFIGSFTYRTPDITKFESNPDFVGNQIPLVSPLEFSVGGIAHLYKGLGFSVDYRYYSKRYANEKNDISFGAYSLLDLSLFYTYRISQDISIEFDAFIKNALDTTYIATTGNGMNAGTFGTGSSQQLVGMGWVGTPRTYGLGFIAHF